MVFSPLQYRLIVWAGWMILKSFQAVNWWVWCVAKFERVRFSVINQGNEMKKKCISLSILHDNDCEKRRKQMEMLLFSPFIVPVYMSGSVVILKNIVCYMLNIVGLWNGHKYNEVFYHHQFRLGIVYMLFDVTQKLNAHSCDIVKNGSETLKQYVCVHIHTERQMMMIMYCVVRSVVLISFEMFYIVISFILVFFLVGNKWKWYMKQPQIRKQCTRCIGYSL